MLHADICIAGAGVIGLSLALELEARGPDVVVVETGQPLGEASTAAAGMLAARDPHNPPELSALAQLSVALYPEFLDRLRAAGAEGVQFQTCKTLQSELSLPAKERSGASLLGFGSLLLGREGKGAAMPSGFYLLDEHSVDPRELSAALSNAARASRVRLLAGSPVLSTRASGTSVIVATPTGTIEAKQFIDCTGAWAKDPAYSVLPIKGQMLAVTLPENFPLQVTVRTGSIYIVPRTLGPRAGQAVVGATVEDAGFDKTVHAGQVEELRRQAVALLPQLAGARTVESWAGLRPGTPDGLPLLGAHPALPRHWVAAGHYRNGILLAPATAHVMAQLLLGESPSSALGDFAPSRLSLHKTAHV